MALSQKVHDALNEQLSRELTAHFIYRAIAMDLYDKGYDGFAGWMDQHATEEYGHAERIIAFLRDQDARVVIPALAKPSETWESVKAALEAALGHERKLTADIYKLHALAEAEGDLATISMLDWFVTEQVEEEHIVSRLLKRLALAGKSEVGLVVLDGELRKAAPATAE